MQQVVGWVAKLGGTRKVAAAFVAVVACAAGVVYATNYTLWINGRSNSTAVSGNHADFTYWGPAGTAAGVNKKSVNWDGYNRISDQNYRVRDALDCYCTGANWCYVALATFKLAMHCRSLAAVPGLSKTPRPTQPASAAQPLAVARKPVGTSNG